STRSPGARANVEAAKNKDNSRVEKDCKFI
ncbi:MAG: hypothetical protein ACI883_001369, partial [Candidatus Azotimanducaceae bacterium]